MIGTHIEQERIMLGLTVEDRISGFRGVVTGYVEYLTGCNQALVQQRARDGEYKEPLWFDVQRLVVDETTLPIVLDNGQTPGSDKPAPRR